MRTFSRARDFQSPEMFLPLDRETDFLAWGKLRFWMTLTRFRAPAISAFAAGQLYFPVHELPLIIG